MAVQYDTWYYGVFFHPTDPAQDFYYRSLGLPVPIGATGVDLVLFGLQKASKAEYDAAKALNGTCPGAGTEIPRPTDPKPPTLKFYEYGFVWDAGNNSMYMLARADQGLQVEFFLKAEDGQTEPISGFQYLQGATVSMSIAGTAMNQGSLHGAGSIAPGNWTLYVRNAGDTANDTRKSMRITLPAVTNGGSVQAHSESYFLGGNYAAPEGGGTLLSLYKYVAGVPTGPSNVGFSGVPSGKGLSQSQNGNALTINVVANAVQGDSFNFPLVATVNGAQVLTQTISILDKTAGSGTKPPIVTPTDRVDAIAVQTIPASSDPQSLVTVWLYWKVTGNPVLWVGMYGNNGSVLYEGTDFLTGDYGDGYTRALRTVQQSRGNALRYVARLGSSTGTKVVDKTFDTSFPATGKEVQYSANEIYADADPADFEGSSGPSPDPSGDGFDNSYAFTYTGPNADYNGTTIQRTAAPKIVAVDRTKPRLDGNDYSFVRQTGLNTFVTLRLPTVNIDPAKLIVNYVGMDVNDGTFRGSVIGRGYNTISDPTPNRGSYGRRDRLVLNINGGYDIAQAAASALPGSDARKAILQKWYQDGVDASGQPIHRLIVDGPAAELFGRALYADQTAAQNTDWTMGAPIYAYTPNFEVGIAPAGSGISDEQARMDMIGLVMRGIRKQAIDQGLTPPIFIAYDHGGICHFNVSLISKDITTPNGTYSEDGGNTSYTNADVGVPAYYLPGRLSIAFKGGSADAPMATTNDMVSYGKEFGALYGSQEYPNSTYDDQPIWLKGNDGKPTVRTVTNFDGKAVKLLNYRTDARRTTIMGETADLLGPAPYYICESAAWLEEIYTRATYVVVQYDVRAGNEYMALSNVRQSGFEKVGLVMWTRMDAEFKHPVRLQKPDGSGEKTNPATPGQPYSQEVLNTRPLNPDSVEFDFLWSTVVGLVDAYRNWMGPQPLIAKQGDSSPGNNHARGNYEIQQKAMNRYDEVKWIKSNIVRPMVGELPIRNFARDRAWHNWNDEPEKKMLMGGVFCPARTDKNNKPWIVLCAAYPAQDVDMQTTVTLWPTNTSGQAIGGSYVFRVKGRKTYLDAFQLPDAYATLTNAQWRYQYTDLTGDVRTRTLDWRSPIPTTNLTPPAAA